MRLLLILLFTSFFSAACSNTIIDEGTTGDGTTGGSGQRDIQSITFIRGSGPVPAQQRRNQTLLIKSDLSAEMKITDGYNTVLSEKEGRITRQQFDALSEKLNSVNYIHLKPGKPTAEDAARGSNVVVINSDLGAHRFVNNSLASFPEIIAELFEMQPELMPK